MFARSGSSVPGKSAPQKACNFQCMQPASDSVCRLEKSARVGQPPHLGLEKWHRTCRDGFCSLICSVVQWSNAPRLIARTLSARASAAHTESVRCPILGARWAVAGCPGTVRLPPRWGPSTHETETSPPPAKSSRQRQCVGGFATTPGNSGFGMQPSWRAELEQEMSQSLSVLDASSLNQYIF